MKRRSKETTYKIMSSIKSKNTSPEIILSKAMWKLGLRYRKQYNIKGKPDFVFIKKKIAIFCDGDFWHGNNWKTRGLRDLNEELKNYSEYWKNKILGNMKRDINVNNVLKKDGWKVLRFWESEIKENPEKIAKKIKKVYKEEDRI